MLQSRMHIIPEVEKRVLILSIAAKGPCSSTCMGILQLVDKFLEREMLQQVETTEWAMADIEANYQCFRLLDASMHERSRACSVSRSGFERLRSD